jgi:hypothetical protein
MKNNFNTPFTVKILAYFFIALTPVLLYIAIFILKIHIVQKLLPVINHETAAVIVPYKNSYNHKLQKKDLLISYLNKPVAVDTFYYSSDSIYIYTKQLEIFRGKLELNSLNISVSRKISLYHLIAKN